MNDEALIPSSGPQPHLSSPEMLSILDAGPGILADIETMGRCLDIALPLLSSCKVDGYKDWHTLAMCTHFAQLIGSRVMAKYCSWCAGTNSQLALGEREQILCLCARIAGGDFRLLNARQFMQEAGAHGYYLATRVGFEAYWRGEADMLGHALERIATAPTDRLQCVPIHHETDLLLLEACQERLETGMTNLVGVFLHISQLDPEIRAIYARAASSLFLAGESASTVASFTEGFGLLGDSSIELPELGPQEKPGRSGSWFDS